MSTRVPPSAPPRKSAFEVRCPGSRGTEAKTRLELEEQLVSTTSSKSGLADSSRRATTQNDFTLSQFSAVAISSMLTVESEVPTQKKVAGDKDLIAATIGSSLAVLGGDRVISSLIQTTLNIYRLGGRGEPAQTLCLAQRCSAQQIAVVQSKNVEDNKMELDVQVVLGFITGDVVVYSCTSEAFLSRVNSTKAAKGAAPLGAVSAIGLLPSKRIPSTALPGSGEASSRTVTPTSESEIGLSAPGVATDQEHGGNTLGSGASRGALIGFKSGVLQRITLNVRTGSEIVQATDQLVETVTSGTGSQRRIPGIKAIAVNQYCTSEENEIAAISTTEGHIVIVQTSDLSVLHTYNHQEDSFGNLISLVWGPGSMLYAGGEDDVIHCFQWHGSTAAAAAHAASQSGGAAHNPPSSSAAVPPAADIAVEDLHNSHSLGLAGSFGGTIGGPSGLTKLSSLENHSSWIGSLATIPLPPAVSDSGRVLRDYLVVAGSQDNTMTFWHMEDASNEAQEGGGMLRRSTSSLMIGRRGSFASASPPSIPGSSPGLFPKDATHHAETGSSASGGGGDHSNPNLLKSPGPSAAAHPPAPRSLRILNSTPPGASSTIAGIAGGPSVPTYTIPIEPALTLRRCHGDDIVTFSMFLDSANSFITGCTGGRAKVWHVDQSLVGITPPSSAAVSPTPQPVNRSRSGSKQDQATPNRTTAAGSSSPSDDRSTTKKPSPEAT